MMLPRCIDLKRQFYLQQKELYAFADECFEMSDIILQAIEDLKLKDTELSGYQFIVSTNFYKTTDSFLSVMSLCNDGLIGDAESIARKLLEISVTLKYLSLDIGTRQDQYLHFQSLSKYRKYSEIKKEDNVQEKDKIYSNWLSEQIKEFEPQIIENYKEAKKYFKLNDKGEVEEIYFRGWSGKSLKKMAKECGMHDQIIPYMIFCASVHASVDDVDSFYSDDKVEFGPKLSVDDISIIIITATGLYLQIIEMAIGAFSLKLNDSLELLKKHLEKFKDHPIFKN